LATNGVIRAAKPLNDVLKTLAERPDVKEITVGSSESECKTGIPLDVDSLSKLLKNPKLVFKLHKTNVTAEQQRLLVLALAHFVFDKCTFEADGALLLGRPRTSKMHVNFGSAALSLMRLCEALDKGWLEHAGFYECHFEANDLQFLQKLHDASRMTTLTFH
jgi:hypothetical protein